VVAQRISPIVITKMKINKKVLRFIIALMLLSVISCGIDPLTAEESPDKSIEALAYVYRIGPSATYISISEKKGSKEIALFKLEGKVPVSFKWINDKEINICIPNKSLIKKTIGNMKGIKINLIEEKHVGS